MLLPLVAMAAASMSRPAPPSLGEFEAVLARQDSATLALEEWCSLHGIADPATLVAAQVRDGADPSHDEAVSHLALAPDETVTMRHVQLRCGDTVLSNAWNWYVPQRLTADMNAALASTDTPFGKVVGPLKFRRQSLGIARGAVSGCPAATISTHRARLVLPDGRPLAYLIECYTPANLVPAQS